MKAINENNKDRSVYELSPGELQAVQGGSLNLASPVPWPWDLAAHPQQPCFGQRIFWTVKANPSLINGGF